MIENKAYKQEDMEMCPKKIREQLSKLIGLSSHMHNLVWSSSTLQKNLLMAFILIIEQICILNWNQTNREILQFCNI